MNIYQGPDVFSKLSDGHDIELPEKRSRYIIKTLIIVMVTIFLYLIIRSCGKGNTDSVNEPFPVPETSFHVFPTQEYVHPELTNNGLNKQFLNINVFELAHSIRKNEIVNNIYNRLKRR